MEIVNNLDRIEAYLKRNMSIFDKSAFEKDLDLDPVLEKETLQFMAAKEGIRNAAIRSAVMNVHQQFSYKQPAVEKPTVKAMKTNIWRIAAAIMLALGSWSAFQISSLSPADIISSDGIVYESAILRSTEAEEEKLRDLYKNHDFNEILKTLPTISAPESEQYFIGAMSAYQTNDFDKANQYLELVNDRKFEFAKAYYKGMIAVGLGEYDKAIQLLQEVKNNESNPYSKAVDQTLLLKVKILDLKKSL